MSKYEIPFLTASIQALAIMAVAARTTTTAATT